VKTIKRICR